jgi:hypothetical protein
MSELAFDAALSALSRSGWRDPAAAARPFGREVEQLVRVAADLREELAVELSAEASARHLQLIAHVAEGLHGSRSRACWPPRPPRRWSRSA